MELHEGISLLEAVASSSSLTRPDGTTVKLGFDAHGNAKDGGVFDEKGRVPLHIIRPGIGKGRGRHLYEANMLQEAAPNFKGWRMFVNHLSPEAKKAAAGLPRDVRDLGGRVQEAWWDGNVAANDQAGHGQGAVMGMVRPVKAIRELIDDDPELIEASISANATAVRPVTRDGQRVWLVEGIQPRGSVDWVTEAGAGGRIAPLLQEAYAEPEDVQEALFDSLTDDEIVAHLRQHRPALLQEAEVVAPDDKERTALSESPDDPEGGDVAEITPEALSEALAASPNLLIEALTTSAEAQVFLSSLVEAKLDEERDVLRAESKADVDRAFELARMERTAHGIIAESKLPQSWQADLRARYSLVENAPAAGLDVVADVDDDGKTVKSADEKLREAVEADIEHQRERLREASSTRVRSSAAPPFEKKADKSKSKSKKKDGDDDGDDDGGDDAAAISESRGPKPYWAQMLEEAGIKNPEKAYVAINGQ